MLIDEVISFDSTKRHRFLCWGVFPLCLAGVVLVQGFMVWRSIGITYDETYYLLAGQKYFAEGKVRKFIEGGVAPLPILLSNWLPALNFRSQHLDHRLSHKQEADAIKQARLAYMFLVGLPLMLVVYIWLLRRRGWLAALVGGLLVSFSPSLMAHVTIATTDACLSLFLIVTLAALIRYASSPSWHSLAFVGFAFGLAISSKLSALTLLPVVVLSLIHTDFACSPEGAWVGRGILRGLFRVWGRLSVVCLLAMFTLWLLLGFKVEPALGVGNHQTLNKMLGSGRLANVVIHGLERLPVPMAIRLARFQFNHAVVGHETYLMGKVSTTASPWYFPIAFVIKSTPSELVLALGLVVIAASRRARRDWTLTLWLLTIFFLGIAVVINKIAIGLRYILPIYPLMILCVVDGLFDLVRTPQRRFLCAALLVLPQAFSALSISPAYLSYFNACCGGPVVGHEYLVDSNNDWGQDLPALAKTLNGLGAKTSVLAYFGTDHPDNYGIKYVKWDTEDAKAIAESDFVVVSVTLLHGVYVEGKDPFRDFRGLSPVGRAAYSMFVYDLRDPVVKSALDKARERYFQKKSRVEKGPSA